MELKQILNTLNIENNSKIKINKITTDSTTTKKNDLFIAIGKGSDYIKQALKNKSYVITEKNYNHKRVYTVKNSIESLGKIANLIRKNNKIPLIAVTGSAGKTTTKEFIYQLLSIKYNVLKNKGNQNNNIGVPLTLLNLTNEDIIVLELGMNHFEEISNLSKICEPSLSIITNIGTAHIGHLKTKKNILKAKLEILNGMDNKILLVNQYDSYLKKIKETIKSNIKIKKVNYQSAYTTFILKYNNNKYQVKFNIPGKHMLEDLIISIRTAIFYGVNIQNIIELIPNLKTTEGRLNIQKNKVTLIDDCYNSSYEALKEGLIHLKKYHQKKIIILSDMLELGKHSRSIHKKINKYLKKIKNKEVLLYGPATKVIKGTHFDTKEEIIKYLKIIKDDDVIYLKGSNSTNLKEIVYYIKNTYFK